MAGLFDTLDTKKKTTGGLFSKIFKEEEKTAVVSPASFAQAERAIPKEIVEAKQKEDTLAKFQTQPGIKAPEISAPGLTQEQTVEVPKQLYGGLADLSTGLLNTARMINKPVEATASALGKPFGFSQEQSAIGRTLDKGVEFTEGQSAVVPMPEDATLPERIGYGAVRSLPQMAPALLGAPTPVGLGTIGASAFGTGAREAEKEGATGLEQVTAGAGSALVEVATEYLPLKKLEKFVGGKGTAKDLVVNMFEEFVGESVAEALAPVVEQVYNRNAVNEAYVQNTEQTLKRIGEAGLTGAFASILINGAVVGAQSVNKAINNPTPENIEQVKQEVEEITGVAIPDLKLQQAIQQTPQLEVPKIDLPQDTFTPQMQPVYEAPSEPKASYGVNYENLSDIWKSDIDDAVENDILEQDPNREYEELDGRVIVGDLIVDYEATSQINPLTDEYEQSIVRNITKNDIGQLISGYEHGKSNVSDSIYLTDIDGKEIRISDHKRPSVYDDLGNFSYDHKYDKEIITDSAVGIFNEAKKLIDSGKIQPKQPTADTITPTTQPTGLFERLDTAQAPLKPLPKPTNKVVELVNNTKLLHGTNVDFDSFDITKIGDNTGNEGIFGKGFYLTDNELAAKSFGDNIMNVTPNVSNPFVIDKNTDLQEISDITGNDIPNDGLYDDKASDMIADKSQEFTDALKTKGYDSVVVIGPMSNGISEMVVFDPNNLSVQKPTTLKPLPQPTGQGLFAQMDGPTRANATMDVAQVENRVNELVAKEYTSVAEAETALKELQDLEANHGMKMNLQFFAESRAKLEEVISGMRKTFGSIQQSSLISDEAKATLDPIDFEYESVTNEDTLEAARKDLGSVDDFMALDQLRSEVDTAKGIEHMRLASQQGDFATFNKLAVKHAELLTKAGRTVQAASMLRKMTPEGQLQYLTKEIAKQNETGKKKKAIEDIRDLEELIKNATPEQVKKVKEILTKRKIKYEELTPDKINDYIDQIKKQADIAELTEDEARYVYDKIKESLELEGREKEVAIAEAYKVIEDKMRTSGTERFAALQRISMLLNLKTQSRNVLGNVLMQAAEVSKEAIAIPLDIALSKKTGERTITAYNRSDINKGIQGLKKGLHEAYDDYMKGINTRRDSGQFEIRAGKIFPTNTRYKSLNKVASGLNKANNLTSFLLSAGDRPFFEATYNMEKSRLERLPQYEGKPDMVEKKAIEVAEERTFQNRSKLADSVVQVRNKAGLFGRIVLPYAYTPANITDKVFDYSPLGSVRTIGKNVVRDIKKGEFNQREFAERASRNLTGSAIMMLGFYLAKAGIITGAYSDDKDEREFQKSIGIQDYAFAVGNKQINFDWAQPIAVPFATGANLYQEGLTETNAKQNIFNKMAQVSIESSKTLLEQPLLTGIQDLFGGYGSEGVLQNVANIVKTAPLQVVPGLALARQTRQTIDPTIRNVDYNSLLDQLRNQMPVLSETLPEKYSTLGEEQQYSGGVLQKFVSPATITTLETSPLEQEILDVFKATGDNDIFPKKAPTSFTYKKVVYELSKVEQSEYQQAMGIYVRDSLEKLMTTANYKKLSDEAKAKMIAGIISDGGKVAKAEYREDNEID